MSPARSILLSTLAVAALALAAEPARAGEFVNLSRYLPEDANAVIVVNAEAMYNSPLGKKENWRQKFADASESAPLMLPPTAQHAVLAAELDIETLRPDWEAAIMTLSVDPTIEQVAQRHHGLADGIGKLGAAWLPPNLCVVKFAPKLFGLLTQANRQEATRWVHEATDANVQPLSPYLEHAVSYADTAGAEMILAVDLANALHGNAIRDAVARSKVLDAVPEEEAATLFTGLQGVKLGVIVTDKLNAKLQIDFAGDTAMLAPVAKPVILDILSASGAMLDEFDQWTAEAKGTSLSLQGELTPAGLQRIFSLLSLDASSIRGDDPDAPAAAATATKKPAVPLTPEQLTAKASLRYFKAVDKYVQDSQNLSRAGSLQRASMWLDNFARRVENLSTRNVDPDLVKYGAYVSQTFRYVVSQAYGVEDKTDQLNQAPQPVTYQLGYVPSFDYVNWGGNIIRQYAPYSYANYDLQADAATKQKTQDEIYKMMQDAKTTLTELAANAETVRKNLTQKFGEQF